MHGPPHAPGTSDPGPTTRENTHVTHAMTDDAPIVAEAFAGPGGWSMGLRTLLEPLRIRTRKLAVEWDDAACRTAVAAGHPRVRADVTRFALGHLRGLIWLLIMSPSCQAWSRSGKRKGILDQEAIFRHAQRVITAGEWIPYADAGPLPVGEGDEGGTWHDARSPLVLEVLRWVIATEPTNIALEQVPDVLPFWQLIARWLKSRGYNVWVGCLSAERYGVPQTRQRAILVASLERTVGAPPATHTAYDPRLPDGGKWHGTDGDLFGNGLAPWTSMAEALGWVPASVVNTRGDRKTSGGNEFGADRPSWALTEKTRSWTVRTNSTTSAGYDGENRVNFERAVDHPAPTVVSRADLWTVRTGNNSMVTSRTGSKAGDGGVQPYERPIEHPAPTLDTQVGSKWRLHTNRDQRPDGTRQVIDPAERPAPTLTGKSGGQWELRPDATGDVRSSNGTVRDVDAPAGTITASPDNGNHQWVGTTTTARVTVQEAAVLQSFPADYPWQGTKSAQFRQVGDAVPPLLAAHVLAEVLGVAAPGAA